MYQVIEKRPEAVFEDELKDFSRDLQNAVKTKLNSHRRYYAE